MVDSRRIAPIAGSPRLLPYLIPYSIDDRLTEFYSTEGGLGFVTFIWKVTKKNNLVNPVNPVRKLKRPHLIDPKIN